MNFILEKYYGQVNVNGFKIDCHIGFANLASFHHKDSSGLLLRHSWDHVEMSCSYFVFVEICLRLIPKLK